MRKFSKLILAILPVSSLTVFSVVSCSTNDKKPIETPKTPNNKTPDNQPKQPENKPESDENHNSDKSNEEVKPDGEPSPGKPDNNPNNSHSQDEHKQPDNNSSGLNDNNNSNSDQPQADDPVKSKNNIDFSDLEILNKEIDFKYITTYNNKSAKAAWAQIKSRGQDIFKEIIFNKNKEILEKYKIEFDSESFPEILDEKGIINKVKIKFTKFDESKIFVFSFVGFEKQIKTEKDNRNNKNDYIKIKDKIDKEIKGLYPSLVAYMLLYVEDQNKYNKDIKQSGNVVNFQDLENKNERLFDRGFPGFSIGTKELLFEYKEEYRQIYKDKIINAGYDDLNGTLELEVQIKNTDEHTNNDGDPLITKRFKIDGFRKIDLNNNNNNLMFVDLLQNDFKEIVNKGSLKETAKQFITSQAFNRKISLGDSNQTGIKNEIFKKLIVNINDKMNIYKTNQILKLDYNSGQNYKSILGLKNNMSIYPFHTRVNKDSIKDIYLTITNENWQKKAKIDFTLYLNIYAASLSDLTDNTYASDKILKLEISQTAQID
ncbi:LppA family lipoprotein [Mycoplasma feriruminatoris]|uniref:LppA family lipoprotein n=1 Tax=Mycoplasma feriruminatoris TaxID=1179777 RepID=UPI00241FC77C|nr:LppA family lipoprotein [Mycoplasma feriruminatoris]WFQ91245.1 LppA family lipoprotein [Mycoplasma feriruminatoris]